MFLSLRVTADTMIVAGVKGKLSTARKIQGNLTESSDEMPRPLFFFIFSFQKIQKSPLLNNVVIMPN